MARGILGHLAKLLEAALALRRLPLLQPLLVRDGLLLHVFDIERPAPRLVGVQLDRALRPRVGGADERDPERFLEILYDAKRARG